MGTKEDKTRTEKDSRQIEVDSGEWRILDVINNVEYRQLSMDTFQLRNPTHYVTINAEGFNAWRDNTESFERWLGENGVFAETRIDIK